MLTFSRYLGWVTVVAVLGWAALGITLWRLDPYSSTALALPFFFGAAFLALTGTLTLLGFYSRVWFRTGEVFYEHLSISLRQGILLSLGTLFAILLQILRVLTWWDSVLIVAAIALVEVYFSARDA
jgi:hypothetical protein